MNPVTQSLSGAEVTWEGTDAGLMPELVSTQGAPAAEPGADAIPQLIDALDDPVLFVVAHVLLTRLTAVEYGTFPTWNHLAVGMKSDGSVSIDPEQRFRLAADWRRWYSTDPRPAALPASV